MLLYNPYDYIGVFHNNCLDNISSSPAIGNLQGTGIDKNLIIIEGIGAEISTLNSSNTKSNHILDQESATYVRLFWNEYHSKEQHTYENLELEKEIKFLCKKLLNIDSGKYEVVIEKINEIEQDLLSLSDSSKVDTIVPAAVSVAKNSATYWNEVEETRLKIVNKGEEEKKIYKLG